MKTTCLAGRLVLSWLLVLPAAVAALNPCDLTCEYVVNPLGVDVARPRLSWKVASPERAQIQTAYHILVASSAELLARDQGDLWDSQTVGSDETLHLPYAGQALRSGQQAFWKVRVWDRERKASDWSPVASWTMGLLAESEWQAKWISAADTNLSALLLRREFPVKPGLQRALVFVCGLAQYEMSINGQKVGADLLTPGWTKYDKTCLYDTRDVTSLLQSGTNAIGLTVGNGMYRVTGGRYVKFKGSFGPLQAIARLRLEYADGAVETIGTDGSWRTHRGPLTFTCVFGGEDFDARLIQPGWDRAGFADREWTTAVETAGPGGALRGQSHAAPAVRVIETIRPVSTKPLTNGVEVWDLGQNAPIMPRLVVTGLAGAVVRITPAELLNDDGSVDRTSVGRRPAYWQYTLAGGGQESWTPQFFYHGGRYLQVERLPAQPDGERPAIVELVGNVVHSTAAPVGEFACSNDLFNRIRVLVRWAQRANMVSVLTDCPHRERLGWLEQYHLNGPALRYEFKLDQLFVKSMIDMRDSQLASGMVPSIAPEYTVFGKGPADESNAFRNSPEWGSAVVLVPWQQYQFTGDTGLLREHYDAMKRYVAYLESRATNHIVSFGLGDWYDIGPKPPGESQLTPRELTATAFYYHDTWVLGQMAQLLGRQVEARQLMDQAEHIRAGFNAKFFDPVRQSYATASQCANAIPLVMGLVAEPNRAAVLAALVQTVEADGLAVTAGDVGYRYLLRALADGGRSDLIFAMNHQSAKPGYGYQLRQGATSLTEAWDARRASSQNHFMLGQIMEWFYGDLAGITPDPAGPGFKRFLLRPQPVGDITWAKARYDSVRGPIESHWQRAGDNFRLKVVVPANTTATVYLPARPGSDVLESGAPAARQPGVTFLRHEVDRVVFVIGSGTFDFESRW
jgi:alpha-L-rhamnosidase